MKLEHLTPAQAAIFRVIRQHGETSRGRIIETLCRKGPHKMPEGTVSSCLSRLEGFGFIARPDEAGAGWRLTAEGAALFALESAVECVDPPCPEPQPQDAPEPEPEPEPEPALSPDETLADLARTLAEPSIIDQHLAFVRAQLTAAPRIPGDAARVYREILHALPLSLVEALLPITKLVEARS